MKKTDGYYITINSAGLLEGQNVELRKKCIDDLIMWGKCVTKMKDGEQTYVPIEEWPDNSDTKTL
jgi:hypothetical protein